VDWSWLATLARLFAGWRLGWPNAKRQIPRRYPAENIADLVAAGVIRAPFPASVGGSGSSLVEAVDAIESIARVAVNRIARGDAARPRGSVFVGP
jgi:alkylation response protein AidB-like acyl-CoA dehydrogenase